MVLHYITKKVSDAKIDSDKRVSENLTVRIFAVRTFYHVTNIVSIHRGDMKDNHIFRQVNDLEIF